VAGCTSARFILPDREPHLRTALAFCKWYRSANVVAEKYDINSSGLRSMYARLPTGSQSKKSRIPWRKCAELPEKGEAPPATTRGVSKQRRSRATSSSAREPLSPEAVPVDTRAELEVEAPPEADSNIRGPASQEAPPLEFHPDTEGLIRVGERLEGVRDVITERMSGTKCYSRRSDRSAADDKGKRVRSPSKKHKSKRSKRSRSDTATEVAGTKEDSAIATSTLALSETAMAQGDLHARAGTGTVAVGGENPSAAPTSQPPTVATLAEPQAVLATSSKTPCKYLYELLSFMLRKHTGIAHSSFSSCSHARCCNNAPFCRSQG
jgi:hypothetical protein